MRVCVRLRLLLPLVLVFLAFVSSAQATPLRVLSWNVQFGQGTDGITNFDRTAAWIARMNPDVVALCEMPPDQISTLVNSLSQKTGRVWNSHFVPKFAGSPEGNLILSTYSFSSLGSRYLSYERSIAQVTINVGGQNINFFATHLDHTSSGIRQIQAQELIDWTSGFASPRIVAGDMNAATDTPEVIRLLGVYRDSWLDALNMATAQAYPDNVVWANTRTRRWRIDFILYSADLSILNARASNIPDTRDLSNTNVVNFLGTADDKGVRPSDHNLVASDFEVAAAAAPAPSPVPAPVLYTQPNTTRAVAMHSVLFTDEPFAVRSPVNLGSDQRTRILLFGSNLDLLAGDTLSSISVRATDSRGLVFSLPVEQILKVPNFTWLSELTVRLPDDQTISGDLRITATFHNAASNTVLVGIRAP